MASSAGKEPLRLLPEGTQSGWGANYRHAKDTQKFEVVSKGGSIGSKGPSIMGEHDTVEQAREHAKRLTKQLTPGERGYYGMGYVVRPKKSVDATDRRTRLHAALDAVLDVKDRRLK